MSNSASYASEALVGPPSQPISIRDFVERSHKSSCIAQAISWSEQVPEEARQYIEQECSVVDLEASLNETLSNPLQYAFLVRGHDKNIDSIRNVTKFNQSRKRKRIGTPASEEAQPEPEVQQLRNNLENIPLSCWSRHSYPSEAAFFIHPQKNSDMNTLPKPKRSRSGTGSQPTTDEEAVLIVSVYDRLSWGNHLSRSSQHAVLASQTIGDLYDIIPCSSNEIPSEIIENAELVGYKHEEAPSHRGAVVCIEGVAYGDGQADEDYSDKLNQQIDLLPEKKRMQITKGTCMYNQRFEELTVRLNQAYWLLHQGTCEHFLIIDSIRILHPDDPPDGYPLTLHIAPPIVDLCMACSRVPATLAVVGDIRLGQSPFNVCRPCWTHFGQPNPRGNLLIVPLPKHEHGWSGVSY